LLKLL